MRLNLRGCEQLRWLMTLELLRLQCATDRLGYHVDQSCLLAEQPVLPQLLLLLLVCLPLLGSERRSCWWENVNRHCRWQWGNGACLGYRRSLSDGGR